MDDLGYADNQNRHAREYEALCKRCGKCCGSETDPCANLRKGADNLYYCSQYGSRLGMQTTVSGRTFTCVSIREVVRKGLPNENCGYAR